MIPVHLYLLERSSKMTFDISEICEPKLAGKSSWRLLVENNRKYQNWRFKFPGLVRKDPV